MPFMDHLSLAVIGNNAKSKPLFCFHNCIILTVTYVQFYDIVMALAVALFQVLLCKILSANKVYDMYHTCTVSCLQGSPAPLMGCTDF